MSTWQDMKREQRALRSEVIRIRESRSMSEQRAIARSGRHPIRDTWWPAWKEWTHIPNMMRSIMTRFTSGPMGTGRMHGLKRTSAKTLAARENARQPRPRARLGARQLSRTSGPANGSVGGPTSRPSDRGAR
jgi:hypothetical protein